MANNFRKPNINSKLSQSREMYDIFPNGKLKKLILFIFISCTILLTVTYYDTGKFLAYQVLMIGDFNRRNLSLDINSTQIFKNTRKIEINDILIRITNYNVSEEIDSENTKQTANTTSMQDQVHYLVSSSKCKIIDINPFSSQALKFFKKNLYKSCNKHPLLTKVIAENNTAIVRIEQDVISQYTKNKIKCCYSNIARVVTENEPDNTIKYSDCQYFQNQVTINKDAIYIKCTDKKTKSKIYENVHTSIKITENVQEKLDKFDNSSSRPLSIIFIGIDSISRLNFIRTLSNTFKYIEDNGWIPLKGYNKMDDNTFPNLMAILTGFNQSKAYDVCKPRSVGFLDKCPILWNNYRNFGYTTAYAEDETGIATFNYHKKGFINPPTDYYFRPYMMAAEQLGKIKVDSLNFCTGPQNTGERILNLAKEFGIKFKDYPHFGFFWMNSFSHNNINTPSRMDNKIKSYFIDMQAAGVLNSSIIVFLSDHGMRFGNIRLTETGWLEERLPFIYFSFPQYFKDHFPNQYTNFILNMNQLTTPYDLHMTLQHLLVLAGYNHTIKKSDACPNCVSLFERVPSERSCEDVGIVKHWCTCTGYIESKLDSESKKKLTDFVLNKINAIIDAKSEGNKCANYRAGTVTTRNSQKLNYKNENYVLVSIKTVPKAVFETTVSYKDEILNSNLSLGDVSRLDYYNPHSRCVSDEYLKKYCYCKS